MRPALVIFVVILWLGLALSLVRADLDTGDMTNDQRCQKLRVLNTQYRGVALTADQKATKEILTAWYRMNCRGRSKK